MSLIYASALKRIEATFSLYGTVRNYFGRILLDFYVINLSSYEHLPKKPIATSIMFLIKVSYGRLYSLEQEQKREYMYMLIAIIARVFDKD